MSESEREFEVVVFGATGFTGRLVAEYLLANHGGEGAEGGLRWALAGRSLEKLERVREALRAGDLPLVVADSGDEASVTELARRTRVVCTTVGPYALYGSHLVGACAREGTHYCDLTGEVPWMHAMITAHEETAKASGACIVHSCGFDSIPSDLGVLFLQDAMRERHGAPARHVKGRVAGVSGGWSGGTAASLVNMLEETSRDPGLRKLLADPYALNPPGAPRGDDRDEATGATYDRHFRRWTIPFPMAAINTRVVRRSNALMDFAYGQDFRYDESMLAPAFQGALGANLTAFAMGAGTASMTLQPVRAMAKLFLPASGQGPSARQRERGYFDLRFCGIHRDDESKNLMARVRGDRDPGYGSTSKMLGESAVCLARDEPLRGGGFWTPASAMGQTLIARLEARAGLSFTIESRGR